MIRTLKAAALTAALSAAALVSTPAVAFADQSHGRPITLHCDGCRLPSGGGVIDRGRDDRGRARDDRARDDRGGLDENHRGIIVTRGGITDDRRGITEDRGDYRRHDRSIVIEVSRNAGPLMLRNQRPGSDWSNALHAGSSIVRVHREDSADYRGLNHAGSVQIVVRNGRTECDAQGRLRCAADGSVVRIYRF